jgi:hypothetical protein
VSSAAESPAGGDLGDGEVAKPGIGEIISALAQPLLADPSGKCLTVACEEPVQL